MLDTMPPAPNLPDHCPGGCPHTARLNLLTSMVRYYVCDRCSTHWQVARLDVTEPLSTPASDVAG
jgi:hypothetical protein